MATRSSTSMFWRLSIPSISSHRLVPVVRFTALGKAILSKMEPMAMEEAFRTIRVEHNTPKTITNVGQLRRDLAQSSLRGYALDDEESVTGARCIAAAILR